MMICVVIKGPTFFDVENQIAQACQEADLIEMRLDLFAKIDIPALHQLRQKYAIPMIFTLRSASQGGNYAHPESERLQDITKLASLKPEYMDVETHVPASFCIELALTHPTIKFIHSYHDFTEPPKDLKALFQEISQRPAWGYKIALQACSILDTFRLMHFAKNVSENLIAISMGNDGQISRIITKSITYACLTDHQQTASGQLTAKVLRERYRYPSISQNTHLYGLIGNPVEDSIGDVTHNTFFADKKMDARYLKMRVQIDELPSFLNYAKSMNFKGLSVTMPLKEAILPYLDHVDAYAKNIGAVNTVAWRDGKSFGFNTDGIGALNAIERTLPVRSQRMVIIGAGGAARAIAYEAVQRGAIVTIVNRDRQKARLVAESLGCHAAWRIDQMSACAAIGYDLIINCTPVDMPISIDHILPGTVFMDIRRAPPDSSMIKSALDKGCRMIPGLDMFHEQALRQQAIWINR